METKDHPMADAPLNQLILLYIPAFSVFSASWWTGQWSWLETSWAIRTPFILEGRAVIVTDIPEPQRWQELPV